MHASKKEQHQRNRSIAAHLFHRGRVRDKSQLSVRHPRRKETRRKDAMGAITRMTHTDGSSLTLNVEYNQLDLIRVRILAGHHKSV